MNPLDRPWRVGRSVGRTIYAMAGEQGSDADPLIGVMDTPELAAEAVRAHNAGYGGVPERTREALSRQAL